MELLGDLYDVAEVAVPILVLVMAARRHRASVAIAWFAFALVLPLLALGAYLYLGHYRTERDRRSHERVAEIVRGLGGEPARQLDGSAAALAPRLARAVERAGAPVRGRRLVGGNRVELIDEGEEMIERLLADVADAREHVHLLLYLFNDDRTGRRVAEALREASRRGVRTRLLVGAYAGWLDGSRSIFRDVAPALERAGVEVCTLRAFDPIRNGLRRIDLRNHRKLAVIDGRVAWTGSQNVHDPDLHLARRGGRWRQVSVRIEGPAAHELQAVFLEDWLLETGRRFGPEAFPHVEPAGDVAVQTLWWGPSGDRLSPWLATLFAALGDAHRRIAMTTPYFVPDDPLEAALAVTALRGVEVDLVLPARSDKRWADAAARAHFQRLLDAGVRIHEHQPLLLHAKTIAIDDRVAIVGSGNLDWRSLHLDYEVAVAVYDPAVARRLCAVHDVYRAESQLVDPAAWRRRPAWRETLEAVADLGRPLL